MKCKTPTLMELYHLLRLAKSHIYDDCRAFEDDDAPGIQITVGADETGWGWQSGDNSYSGAAYHYKHWGVVGVYKNSNCRELASEIKNQIEEAWTTSQP
jgi:hypothetical protein